MTDSTTNQPIIEEWWADNTYVNPTYDELIWVTQTEGEE